MVTTIAVITLFIGLGLYLEGKDKHQERRRSLGMRMIAISTVILIFKLVIVYNSVINGL